MNTEPNDEKMESPDSKAATAQHQEQQGEFQRARKGLDSMQVEEELHSSLDGTVTVYKGREKYSLLYVQVKRITKGFGDETVLTDVVNEVRVLSKLSHDRILQHIAWYQTPRHVWVVSELCAGGSLREVLIHHSLETETVKDLVRDLCSALRYLHMDRQMAHGDIRPENILLTENGVAKLSGFALAQSLNGTTATNALLRLKDHIKQHAEYSAPELLVACASTSTNEPRLTAASDVWNLGVTLYECTIGSHPFTGTSFYHLMERICEDEPNYYREGTLREFSLASFLKLLLRKKPLLRITGESLKQQVDLL